MKKSTKNGVELRALIEGAGLTQPQTLALVNAGQAFPIALSTWKAYLAADDSKRRRVCPDHVLKHAEKVLSKIKKSS